MDDKRIEDLLRGTLQPVLPDGMRDRTLRLARQELAGRRDRPRIFGMDRWKVAFVSLGIAIVVFTSIADHMRGERMAAMLGGDSGSISSPASIDNFMKMRQEMYDTLARVPVGSLPQRSKGGDSL